MSALCETAVSRSLREAQLVEKVVPEVGQMSLLPVFPTGESARRRRRTLGVGAPIHNEKRGAGQFDSSFCTIRSFTAKH